MYKFYFTLNIYRDRNVKHLAYTLRSWYKRYNSCFPPCFSNLNFTSRKNTDSQLVPIYINVPIIFCDRYFGKYMPKQNANFRAKSAAENVADFTLCCVPNVCLMVYPFIRICLEYFTFHYHKRKSILNLILISIINCLLCLKMYRVFHSLCYRVLAFTVGGTILFYIYIFLTSY